jgi:hypothetical protein
MSWVGALGSAGAGAGALGSAGAGALGSAGATLGAAAVNAGLPSSIVNSALGQLNGLLGTTAKKCRYTELTDPQTSDTVVREDATHVYQPFGTAGRFTYIHVDPAAPAPYQIDNRTSLWWHIIVSGGAVLFTTTLLRTLSM